MDQRPAATSGAEFRQNQDNSLKQAIWSNRSKWGKFAVLLIVLIFISTVASLITRFALFDTNYDATYQIALIAPLSGEDQTLGLSLRRGAENYAKELNKAGGIDGKFVGVSVYDNKSDASLSAKLAKSALANDKTIAVIGPWTVDAVRSTATVVEQANATMITPSPQAYSLAGEFKSLFTLNYDQNYETRFLANYMRNVLQEKLVSVVVDVSTNSEMAEQFKTAFERFGIPLRYTWSFDSSDPNFKSRIAEIAKEIKAANDSGAIYLAMNQREAAKLIKSMRDAKAINLLMGPHMLGTSAFAKSFGVSKYELYTDGIITAAPLMYDTANQKVQQFRSRYLSDNGVTPDWIAAYGFESANLVGEALRNVLKKGGEISTGVIRSEIGAYLSSTANSNVTINSLTGAIKFDASGSSNKSIKVGAYDGRFLVSAPTQLQPIETGEVDNFIQAVREGRALYVNDRFMYKTNVVYSGILIKKINNYDPKDQTVEIEFVVWFRYRGDFKPQDIVFNNAIAPVKLDKPDKQETIGELNYKSYKLKAKFDTDFLDVPRNYGSKLMGMSFRHRLLNKNNLIYVVDVVGIGLTGGGRYQQILEKDKVLVPQLGLVIDRAWISQDIIRVSGQGDPNFVGYGKPSPDFSQLDVGIVTVDGTVSLRDLVPNDFLIYITIFAIFGALFAILMDRKREGRTIFWGLQSWILRIICWPLLLASTGSLTLNFAFQNLEFFYVDLIVPIYEALWWLIGARLITMAVERFIWSPLEISTERKVPGSIRASVSVVIFLFAGFGIVAFVLNRELTSLLATSGLLAMIVGLAVQANIANIFSGIVLNLERPFRPGDWILAAGAKVGQVTDITWRSTKIRTFDNTIISLPNAQVAEAQIENFSHPIPKFSIMKTLYFSTHHDPALITELIQRGLDKAKCVDGRDKFEKTLVKLIEVNSHGLEFLVRFDCTDRDVKDSQSHEALVSVIQSLNTAGIQPKEMFPINDARESMLA